MAITRYDPFTRLMTFRDAIDRIFDETFGRTGMARLGAGAFPIDMYERQDELIVTAAVPGARSEDVEISLTPDSILIRAIIHSETEKEEATNWNWYFHELDHGQFTRSISLPFPVSTDQAEARFENGMLYLRLPKSVEARPKRITVQAGAGGSQQIGVGQQQSAYQKGGTQQGGEQPTGQQQGGHQGGF